MSPPVPLRRNRDFRNLWLGRSISSLGDSMAIVALVVYVSSASGAATAVALLLIAGDCVPGLVAPVAGAMVDRLPVKALLIGADIVSAVVVLGLALLPPLPVLIALIGVLGLVATVVTPGTRLMIPMTVPDHDLEAANAAAGFGRNGLEAVGPVLAAALFTVTDVATILIVDAATFVLSALFVAAVASRPVARAATAPTSLLADTREGLRYIVSTPVVRPVAVGFLAAVACTGIDDVALVFLGRDELGADAAAQALLYAGSGVGLALGFVLLVRFGARWRSLVLFLVGLTVSTAGNLATGLAPSVVVVLVLQAVRGLGIAAVDVGLSTDLQRRVPRAFQGRVFAIVYGGAGLAAGVSYVLGSWFLELTDARTTFVTAGLAGLLVAGLTTLALRRGDQ